MAERILARTGWGESSVHFRAWMQAGSWKETIRIMDEIDKIGFL